MLRGSGGYTKDEWLNIWEAVISKIINALSFLKKIWFEIL